MSYNKNKPKNNKMKKNKSANNFFDEINNLIDFNCSFINSFHFQYNYIKAIKLSTMDIRSIDYLFSKSEQKIMEDNNIEYLFESNTMGYGILNPASVLTFDIDIHTLGYNQYHRYCIKWIKEYLHIIEVIKVANMGFMFNKDISNKYYILKDMNQKFISKYI